MVGTITQKTKGKAKERSKNVHNLQEPKKGES
jgi:hypothetical protein